MHAPTTNSAIPQPNTHSVAEYLSGNEVFVFKIDHLQHSFTHFRRTRGDGNCFFRAFLFSYLEGLLFNQDLEECKRSARESCMPACWAASCLCAHT